jgi:hypothetical protein
MNALCDRPLAWPEWEEVGKSSSSSSCDFEILSGPNITLWMAGNPNQETRKNLQLQIAPDQPVIIGRAEGGGVPYLDPAYRSTTLVPGTGETILRGHGDSRDNYVSRAHFMLRAIAGGILLVNGVPKVGGGIRPPRNGTSLTYPSYRTMLPEEEYTIESGAGVIIVLPNGTNVRIKAD